MNGTATVAVLGRRLWLLFLVCGLVGLAALETVQVMDAGSGGRRDLGLVSEGSVTLGSLSVPEPAPAGHAARLALGDAYRLAFGSRRWEPMLAVGDAYRTLGGDAAGLPAVARAREAYLTALFRARQEGSVDAVLRVASAFETLGDHAVVQQAVVMAKRLATLSGDAADRAAVQRFSERLAGRVAAVTAP